MRSTSSSPFRLFTHPTAENREPWRNPRHTTIYFLTFAALADVSFGLNRYLDVLGGMDLCAFSWYKRYRKTHFFLAQFPTGRLVVGPSCIKNQKDHILEVNVRNAWNHWNQKLEIMRYMKNPSSTNSQSSNIISIFCWKKVPACFFCPLTFLAFCRFRLTAPVFMLKLPRTENRYFGHRFPSLEFKLRDLSGGSYFVLPGTGEAKPTWKVNNGHYEQGDM